MKLNDVIRIKRKELGLTLEDIANYCGVGKSIVAKWERGEVTNLRRNNIAALADVLKVSPLVIMGREEPETISRRVPLVGVIACGLPILAEENITDYVDMPDFVHANFALTCQGDSMTGAGIKDGDIVYIRQQPTVENGQIAAVLVDSDHATLKRFYVQDNSIMLLAENPAYPPIVKTGQDMASVRVLGLAVLCAHSLL